MDEALLEWEHEKEAADAAKQAEEARAAERAGLDHSGG